MKIECLERIISELKLWLLEPDIPDIVCGEEEEEFKEFNFQFEKEKSSRNIFI